MQLKVNNNNQLEVDGKLVRNASAWACTYRWMDNQKT